MGQIRITGGTHRSRKITVEDLPGLRPTTDRVRETLFNWLGQNLHQQSVLDLYAGSGILAFEAASRGAKSIVCIDNSSKALKLLSMHAADLQLPGIKTELCQARNYVEKCQIKFDLIFLDPPFDGDELTTISAIIDPIISPGGLLYREFGTNQDVQPMNEDIWTRIKHKKAGQVQFELWQKQ